MSHEKIYEKPVDLSIWEYVASILEINAYFPFYPELIPGIPETKISDRDIKDLVEVGLPNHWKRAMLHQNIMFIEHSLTKMVAFCERLHMTDPNGTPVGQKRVTDATYGKSKKKTGQTKAKADDYDNVCVIRGPRHSSGQCWFI